MATVRELLAPATSRLAEAGVERPGREAALLLRTLLGMSEAALLAHDRDPVAPELAARFAGRIDARARRTPASYLLGEREFFGRDFAVDPRVLIPRPETEGLIELSLQLPLSPRARVLDLGTGSGCLGITLAVERPLWRVVASDASLAALAVARSNAARHGVDQRVRLVAADLAHGMRSERFDLVVANPPYVDEAQREELAPEVREHEPPQALFAGRSGLAIYERLFAELDAVVRGGFLATEIGAGQADAIARLAARAGRWPLVDRRADLAGVERHLLFRRSD